MALDNQSSIYANGKLWPILLKNSKFRGSQIAAKVHFFINAVQFFCVSQREAPYRESSDLLCPLVSEKMKHVREAKIFSPLSEMEFFNSIGRTRSFSRL
jgi:hypothetical protein